MMPTRRAVSSTWAVLISHIVVEGRCSLVLFCHVFERAAFASSLACVFLFFSDSYLHLHSLSLLIRMLHTLRGMASKGVRVPERNIFFMLVVFVELESMVWVSAGPTSMDSFLFLFHLFFNCASDIQMYDMKYHGVRPA